MKCRSGLSSMQMILTLLVLSIALFGWYWYSHRPVTQVVSKNQQAKEIIALLGAPGSGKGTLAKRAVSDFGFITLSTGNLVRENIAQGTELGTKVKEYSQAGKLVPDEIIFGMAKEWLLAHAPEGKTIVLDGFPRTATQAAMLSDFLKTELKDYSLHLIELNVSQEELINRIANRLTCENKACQATYQKR
jgi:adenylate kinase family enzyme